MIVLLKTPLPLAIVSPASEKPIAVVPPAVISNPASPAAPPDAPPKVVLILLHQTEIQLQVLQNRIKFQ